MSVCRSPTKNPTLSHYPKFSLVLVTAVQWDGVILLQHVYSSLTLWLTFPLHFLIDTFLSSVCVSFDVLAKSCAADDASVCRFFRCIFVEYFFCRFSVKINAAIPRGTKGTLRPLWEIVTSDLPAREQRLCRTTAYKVLQASEGCRSQLLSCSGHNGL